MNQKAICTDSSLFHDQFQNWTAVSENHVDRIEKKILRIGKQIQGDL